MMYNCNLRKGVVYIPTVGKRGSVYTDIEPVAVVPVGDSAALRKALLEVIAKKNPIVPPVTGKWPKSLLPKYAGVKSWSAFMRDASAWSIKENGDGIFKIVGYRTHADGYWTEDRDQDIEFPPGTRIDDVVDRMIAILRQAAQG
jgi:hypothetical protein